MLHNKRLLGVILVAATATLPACGTATLLAPLIDSAINDIFNNDQKGDQVPDNTAIGEAVELEIALGGRFCCDPADGLNQRVTIVTLRHTGSATSDPITFQFVPDTGSKLTADVDV